MRRVQGHYENVGVSEITQKVEIPGLAKANDVRRPIFPYQISSCGGFSFSFHRRTIVRLTVRHASALCKKSKQRTKIQIAAG
jgi:hypothetical protein